MTYDQDINANIEVSKIKSACKNIGTFGINNRKVKGVK